MNPNIKILRTYGEKQTKGSLYVTEPECGETIWKCLSLELAWLENQKRISCIPEGEYVGMIRNSNKYGRHLHITGVPNRSYILIHWGNWAGSVNPKTNKPDILGCVMTGSAYADFDGDGTDEISNSKNTFKELMKHFPDEDDFIVKIEKAA